MSLLDRWVKAYRQAWERAPQAAIALGMQLLATPSPFARVLTRDVVVEMQDATSALLIGPRSAAPARVLDPLARHVAIFDEFNYRLTAADDAAHWTSVLRFRFGEREREEAALPDQPLGYYRPHVFGAVKPRLVIPRGEDLRVGLAMVGADETFKLSVLVRYEPEALMVAAGLVEPHTAEAR